MDKDLIKTSPLGHLTAQKHINALEVARNRYLGYLPDYHPTLVRLEHQLGQLKRKVGDADGAEFAEQVWSRPQRSSLTRVSTSHLQSVIG